MIRWQLQPPFFQGPREYEITGVDGEVLKIVADKNGYFDIEKMPKLPLGIFAKHISGKCW